MRAMIAAVLSLVLTGGASASPALFNGGETLDFTLSWSHLSGGSARMTIAPVDGERYRITSIGKSGPFFSRIFKVRDEIESIVSRESFSTLRYHKRLDERGRKKDEVTVIDPEAKTATRKEVSLAVPVPVHDPLSLIYYLRTLELAPGKSFEFDLLADGKLYAVKAEVTGRETIRTPAGRFHCVVVEPKMASPSGVFRDDQHRLVIWYSDDERRLPVRIRSDVRVGSITATLRSAENGVESTEPVIQRGQ